MFDQFLECIGIELLSELYNFSLLILGNINAKKEKLENIVQEIKFENNDILKYDYDYLNTSLVFANCKTFNQELMTEICSILKPMPQGVICITTSQALSDFDKNWHVIDTLRRKMSWGCSIIYIHIKS